MSDWQASEFVVHGRVQGVWFRESTRRRAEELGLSGEVRNQSDGTVFVYVEGPSKDVDALFEWCGVGPRLARVDRVERREVEARDGGSNVAVGFRVTH